MNATQTDDQFVTRRWTANRWQTSIQTLKRREKSGVLTAIKLGRGVRYRLSQILAIERGAEVK
jgi:hypothetical protein